MLIFLGAAWWAIGLRFFASAAAAGVGALLLLGGLSTQVLLSFEAALNPSACLSALFSPFSLLSTALLSAAVLLARAVYLHFPASSRQAAATAPAPQPKLALFFLAAGLLMLAKCVHTFYWLLVWDKTVDPLTPVFAHESEILPEIWSPDSRYWFFLALAETGAVTLHIYDATAQAIFDMPYHSRPWIAAAA